MSIRSYELADRFRLEDGTVFLSGVQALARLPVDQLRLDRRLGLTTAAFASGYQGSPLGTYTEELQRAARAVDSGGAGDDLPIVIQPAVNEELAATAVMGSQLAMTLDDARYDGVVGIWYGKGPGLDRSSDAIRHAVFAGTAAHGGVVAVVGDDPAAKSSTVPSSSDATMVDLHMPLLFPGDVQEALDLSRHAVALSRSCGLWSGIKLVTAVGRRHRHGRRASRPHSAAGASGRGRRSTLRAATERPAAHPIHARHGARVRRGAFGARPPVRRRQRAQPGHRAHPRRLDRHRRVRPHLSRDA